MNIYDRIIPVPQKFTCHPGEDVPLGSPGRANFRIITDACACDPVVKSADILICDTLAGLLNVCACSADGPVTITLKLVDAPDNINIVNTDQGYRLTVAENAVTLEGFGAAGLYYAAVTFSQIAKLEAGEVRLPRCEILDWPQLRTRGHFMESRFGSNCMTLDDWKAVVDNMAEMKMNQLCVSVYGCWCVQYDGRVSEYIYLPIHKYPKLKVPVVKRYWSPEKNGWVDEEVLPPMFEQDFFGELIAYGRTKAVEVFPLFNSYGHNTLIPAQYPEVSAKEEDGTPTLHGFCTRNEKTYEMMFDIYDEIIDRYLLPNGITSFHMGLDEVHGGIANNAEDIFKFRDARCHCPKCKDAEKAELYIDHAIKLMKHLKKRGMKSVYMYSDMLVRHEWGDMNQDSTERMMRAIDENDLRDVAVIDWWTYSDFKEGLMFQSTRPEQGLRRTVKPWNGYYHWNIVFYPLKNAYLLGKMAREEGCEGMQSYSAWDLSYDRVHVAQANYAWNFEGAGSTEDVTLSYAKVKFPSLSADAERALKLFDTIMGTTNTRYAEGSFGIDNCSLMNGTLAYYFYSYVNNGKPYPRSFPGEAMTRILPHCEIYERAMLSIAAMAHQAEDIWLCIAKDNRCDVKLARRYAWEAAHYYTLTEDYLALLQMFDLYGDGKLCKDKKTMLAEIAGARRLARLSLMERFENVKEDFLRPGHMRNHTIFMQFFADLEAYLLRTEAGDVRLNFEDFSPIASEAFWKLR
ncbi:MAG: family 20 glycosylhydrolase [Clostridiales bacterium]|nr:family 20 glycosylhydrolase [Clostridiales bacterium]